VKREVRYKLEPKTVFVVAEKGLVDEDLDDPNGGDYQDANPEQDL
jgi:hypothetical protein